MGRTYGSHYLTEEKRQIAEDNLPLVWWFLNKQVLAKRTIQTHEIDDCSGYLIWHLCIAAESFDPDKGCKFSSYAIKALRHGLCRYLSLRNKFKDRFVVTDFAIEEKIKFDTKYINKTEQIINWNDVKYLFDLVELTPVEEQIIYFYYEQKKTYERIGKLLGYNRERIRQKHGDIILRIKEAVKKQNITLQDFIK